MLLLAGAAVAISDRPGWASPERLQGAWATSAASCDQVFTKRNGRLVFNRQFGDSWSGFIVSGKHVRGARATCDLISSKHKGDILTFLLGCESEIMFDTMTISVRFNGDDSLVRFDPEFPEVETPYDRCAR
ncbi:hypothetical protein LJR009_000023 [Bosea sp. LjRoot9]|uniref:hypothetical protein n=1 Tax=Bosea sp. LjRoot9 TaxID=3342341 RepID=UPI003ED16781